MLTVKWFTTLSVCQWAVGLGGEPCLVGLAGIHIRNKAAVGQPVNYGCHHGLVLKHSQVLRERQICELKAALTLAPVGIDREQQLWQEGNILNTSSFVLVLFTI